MSPLAYKRKDNLGMLIHKTNNTDSATSLRQYMGLVWAMTLLPENSWNQKPGFSETTTVEFSG
jgi:hypothetical protein